MIFADRIKESSTTTGTGAITLAGAETGFRSFSSVLTVGDTVYYCIQGQTPGEWETGIGTYSGTNTLTRTTPLAGSAATPVSFSAGVKDVFITVGAAYFGSVRDHTADGADYALAPGETIYKTYSGATSVPLYVATGLGTYELSIHYTAGSTSITPVTLAINNADTTDIYQIYNGSITTGGTRFILGKGLLYACYCKISTLTNAKTIVVSGLVWNSTPNIDTIDTKAVADNITVWTSLGTLTFPTTQSGTIIIKRIL